MYLDYLNEVFPREEPKKGQLLDRFTKRPYTPDPLDIDYGKTYNDVKKEVKHRHSQPNYHGKSSIPKEHSITAYYANITIDAIRKISTRLAEMDSEERSKLPGVSANRARQIVAGAFVTESVMRNLDLDNLEICPWALREGIVLKYLDWTEH